MVSGDITKRFVINRFPNLFRKNRVGNNHWFRQNYLNGRFTALWVLALKPAWFLQFFGVTAQPALTDYHTTHSAIKPTLCFAGSHQVTLYENLRLHQSQIFLWQASHRVIIFSGLFSPPIDLGRKWCADRLSELMHFRQ